MSRCFNPVTLVIDEASQMTETLAVANISRCFRTVGKVVFVGDINQNNAFTLNELSEFTATNSTSLMERLIKTGVPVTRLELVRLDVIS